MTATTYEELNQVIAPVIEQNDEVVHYTCRFKNDLSGIEAAEVLLERFNGHNRKTIPSRLKKYIDDFLNDNWGETYEQLLIGVKPDGSYFIISGQHRLIAFIEAARILADAPKGTYTAKRLSLCLTITIGTKASEADKVDLGKSRTDGDIIFRDESFDKVRGRWQDKPTHRKKWSNALAVAARLVKLRELGLTVSSAKALSSAEILDYVKKEHKELPRFVTNVLNIDDEDEGFGGLKCSLGYLAALWYVACKNEDGTLDGDCEDTLFSFLTSLANGEPGAKGTPGHSLAGYWGKLVAEKGSKDRDRDWVAPVIRAFNAVLADEPLSLTKIKLTQKQRDNYTACPELLVGYDAACYEAAVDAKIDKESE